MEGPPRSTRCYGFAGVAAALLLMAIPSPIAAADDGPPVVVPIAGRPGREGAPKPIAATSALPIGAEPSATLVAPEIPFRSLGRLERESVEEALASLGLAVDPIPEGKVIGHVYVVTQKVFSRDDWYFQLLNVFHRTTRSPIVARELLLSSGQRWDASLADETVRNLQSSRPLFFADGSFFAAPQISSIVALVPVASRAPDTVDLLAVTRDLWSLRLNSDFEFQKDTLSRLEMSVSENNLFGWRKYLAARFQLDQGRFGFGPLYFDPNVGGSRLTLLATAAAWYARDAERYEGNNEVLSLRYPLYALASRWGGGVDVIHDDVVVRQFCVNQLCPVDVSGTQLPLTYRRRSLTVDSNVVRSFGQTTIQRVTAGFRMSEGRSLVLSSFPTSPADPDLANAFLARWAPRSEQRSEPYARYELFFARYGLSRDLDTFDLSEYRRLGPLVAVEIGAGLPPLGSDFLAYPMSATASWAVAPWETGFALAQVQGSGRVRDTGFIDQRFSTLLYFATPPIAGLGRVVLSASADAVRADTYRTRFFVGGDTGLRGYQIGELQGTTQAMAHAEIRSRPMAARSQRFGAVVFYDVGDAADSFVGLRAHQDVGIGLRWLIPQLNSSVLRIDWAVATEDGPYTRSGLPGRISAGFLQSFWLMDSPKGYIPSTN